MVLIVIGGVFITAHFPRPVSLGLPILLVVAAAALLAINIVLLTRIESFSWPTFHLVLRWAFLSYVVIAGMLEFIFVYDHTPGDVLALLSAMLAVYAVDIPLLFAFSVARYQDPDS
jgi:drug/metabolite transporter (DMT)-like permease